MLKKKIPNIRKIKGIDMYKSNDSKGKKFTYAKVVKKTGFPRTSIMEWVSQEKFLRDKTNKINTYRLDGAERILDTIDIENKLLLWIGDQLRMNIGIGANEIIHKPQELFPLFKDKDYYTLHTWFRRFIERYGYCIPSTTHIGQKLKENTSEIYKNYLNVIRL